VSLRVLVVEDDAAIARLLRDNLEYDGFVVDVATSASEAMARFAAFSPDLVLLDVMLPGGDGFDVCRRLVEKRERPPIIIVSAKSQKEDKIRGLTLGADDYVTKPFSLEELLARVHAVLRRSQGAPKQLTLGDVVLDFKRQRAERAGRDLGLSHRELRLLEYLAERQGKLVTRDELLREVWGYRDPPVTRTVDITVARLRRKIENDHRHPRFLKTLHGGGYCLAP
jgi:DNA-binding response OmpR family regulator